MSIMSVSAHSAARAELPQDFVQKLRDLIGSRLSLAPADREQHGHGESYHATRAPDAVCYAETTDEVASIVTLCAAYDIPIIPFGAGTSLEGHVCALAGGVTIDMSRMKAILAVRPGDLDCTVEAGVTRQQLNAHLRDLGLFFPIDPGGESTIGGMAATRASGTNAVRYGTMRDNVVSLTIVTAQGEIIRTGSRARKSSAGYDLTRLIVGSEGTLGIITEVTLRLYGIPEAISAAVCPFASVAEAVDVVTSIIQYGIPVARVELLGASTVKAVNSFSKLALTVAPTLFFEFHGSEAGVAEQVETVRMIASEGGALGFEAALDAESRNRLWKARHDVHYACLAIRPGAKVWSTDVCVPMSRLAPCIAETERDMESASFPITLVGHVGDGNFHLGLIIDPDSPAELAEAAAFNDRLVRRAIAMDGTSTGEHGVGSGKIKFMDLEHGAGIAMMRAIKHALDPRGILNPGKVLPTASL
jgi:D-lactate dehydrogenase (cytochrome)